MTGLLDIDASGDCVADRPGVVPLFLLIRPSSSGMRVLNAISASEKTNIASEAR